MGKQHEKGKRKRKRKKKTNLSMLTGSLYYCTLLSKEFLLFFTMLIPIDTVMPVRTTRAAHLMISFTIHAFEDMRTWLTIFGNCLIHFLILYATLCFLPIMFSHMSSIALGTPGDVSVTVECRMSPFPAVLTLWSYLGSVMIDASWSQHRHGYRV